MKTDDLKHDSVSEDTSVLEDTILESEYLNEEEN